MTENHRYSGPFPECPHEHVIWIRKEADGTITHSETCVSNSTRYEPAKHAGDIVAFVPGK